MSKKLSGLFDNIAKQNENLSNSIVLENTEDKLAVLSQYKFAFGLDLETENFLKEQTYKVHKTANKMYDELGKIFKETQDRLADHKSGCFVEWFEELGFKKDTVYRYIGRYNLVFALGENQKEFIESLPIKLAYEISKESCPQDLKEKVLSGEIKTLAEFIEQKRVKLSSIEVAEILEEKKDYLVIFEDDLNKFNKYSMDFNYKIKLKIQELTEEKQKSLVEEMEALTRKMEKLINKL